MLSVIAHFTSLAWVLWAGYFVLRLLGYKPGPGWLVVITVLFALSVATGIFAGLR